MPKNIVTPSDAMNMREERELYRAAMADYYMGIYAANESLLSCDAEFVPPPELS